MLTLLLVHANNYCYLDIKGQHLLAFFLSTIHLFQIIHIHNIISFVILYNQYSLVS
ncbi:hypothetical protein VCRA2133E348_120041 [Vibrio crassostreae]|nr:hypothetical protein VCRA2133E348_120041 [Vibrio crassostreae]CAK3115905.1 hypothetical protein VCRA213O314_100041 [Vibrio crassostreae]